MGGEKLGRRARKPVVDRRAQPVLRDRRHRDLRLRARRPRVQRIEQPRRRFGQVARRAQLIIARERAKADAELVVRKTRRAQPHRLARRIMAPGHPPRAHLPSPHARPPPPPPPVVGPSSITIAIRPSSVASTWLALVGLTPPLALALGAASGAPLAASSACIARCPGTRSAIVSSPAVAMLATGQPAVRGTTKVSGPGQKRAASARSTLPNTPSFSAAERSGTCTISGLKSGRPFAA